MVLCLTVEQEAQQLCLARADGITGKHHKSSLLEQFGDPSQSGM